MNTRRTRGTGGILKIASSPYFWIKWTGSDGQVHRESSGIPNDEAHRAAAERLLAKKIAEVAAHVDTSPVMDRVRWDEIAEDLRREYRISKSRSLKDVEKRLKPLDAFFTGRKVRGISSVLVSEYVEQRQADKLIGHTAAGDPIVVHGKGNSTINRELDILKRALKLAVEHGKLAKAPKIKLLKEPPARSGFFERPEYEAVRAHLRPDLQVVLDIAYTLGWRVESEVLTLTWPRVNMKTWTLRLEPGTTKNKDGRTVAIGALPDLVRGLTEQRERVRALEARLGRVIPEVFPHLGLERYRVRPELVGARIGRFRLSWQTACRKAGLSSKLLHDFRRTAVRNFERAGVSRSTAMKITGHKTESVYRRYAIVSEGDIADGTAKLAALIEKDAAAPAKVVPLRATAEGKA